MMETISNSQPTEILNPAQRELVRNTLIAACNIYPEMVRKAFSSRLLCELPICGGLKGLDLQNLKRIENGRVDFVLHDEPDTVKHVYYETAEGEIVCFTTGQFHNDSLNDNLGQQLLTGFKIGTLISQAPDLFHLLDEENYYLRGRRKDIEERLGLRYYVE